MTPEILFDPPPRNLELANGDIHVFCASLDPPLPRLEQFAETLSADERARADRFIFKRDRNRFLAGRGQLREILGWLLRTGPGQLAFAYGPRGKPRLAKPVAGRFLHFNLAHADALVTLIVSAQHEVGIDVEHVRPIPEAEEIAARFFSERECAEWHSQSPEKQMETFFGFWTGKEALLKAGGNGLSESFELAGPRLSSGESLRLLNSTKVAAGPSNFMLHFLAPACGYISAVATMNTGMPFCWKWPFG